MLVNVPLAVLLIDGRSQNSHPQLLRLSPGMTLPPQCIRYWGPPALFTDCFFFFNENALRVFPWWLKFPVIVSLQFSEGFLTAARPLTGDREAASPDPGGFPSSCLPLVST